MRNLGKNAYVTDMTTNSMMTNSINRRPFPFLAALAVILIFASSAFALFAATYLSDLMS